MPSGLARFLSPSPGVFRLSTKTVGSLLLAATLLLAGCGDSGEPPAFKILLEHSGVYAVSWDQLSLAGLGQRRPDSANLGVTHLGEPLPIWLVDGGDGHFDPGDHFEFIGQARPGDRSYFSEHDPWNAYRLSFDGSAVERLQDGSTTAGSSSPAASASGFFSVREHLERDRLMLRFARDRTGTSPEPWYWAKLTQIDHHPFKQLLDLSTLDRQSPRPLSLRIELRGWSKQPRKPAGAAADHRVEVLFNQELIGAGEWDGQEAFVIDIPQVPRKLLRRRAEQALKLRIPQRKAGDKDEFLVDVVMLNWIEIEFPRTDQLSEVQERLFLDGADLATPLRLESNAPPVLYSDRFRIEIDPAADGTFLPPAENARLYAVPTGTLLTADRVLIDTPSSLRDDQLQADYLMIAHRSLKQEIEPLAKLHRERGLAVTVIDAEDIYDEFSHGLVEPRAIRDFIDHAYHHWQAPRPRFVLLVGDASWDTRNEDNLDRNYADWTYRGGEVRRFWKNDSTAYADDSGASRNLIPTWHYQSHEGHAASDNFFVNVAARLEGDADAVKNFHPELAIGRLPVTEPAEVAQIVAKIKRYVETPQVGEWKRRVLWITNENRIYQKQDDNLANKLGAHGYAAAKIYPKPQEKDNVHHQQALLDAFDEGNLLVHFIGHGGRYIWRTGPPDVRKNHDLFTLDHLDQLQPHDRLPVVLSLTCYSAPFDHPSADSIGEKFLRLPDRGAIAVFAASWRNNPTSWFGETLTHELTDRQVATVGEAIRRAKRQIRNADLVETYNLLGDPALPLARPQLDLELALEADRQVLKVRLPTKKFNGQAIVDWHGYSGELINSDQIEVRGDTFEAPCPANCGEPGGTVRIYAWDPRQQLDAVGGMRFKGSPNKPS